MCSAASFPHLFYVPSEDSLASLTSLALLASPTKEARKAKEAKDTKEAKKGLFGVKWCVVSQLWEEVMIEL